MIDDIDWDTLLGKSMSRITDEEQPGFVQTGNGNGRMLY